MIACPELHKTNEHLAELESKSDRKYAEYRNEFLKIVRGHLILYAAIMENPSKTPEEIGEAGSKWLVGLVQLKNTYSSLNEKQMGNIMNELVSYASTHYKKKPIEQQTNLETSMELIDRQLDSILPKVEFTERIEILAKESFQEIPTKANVDYGRELCRVQINGYYGDYVMAPVPTVVRDLENTLSAVRTNFKQLYAKNQITSRELMESNKRIVELNETIKSLQGDVKMLTDELKETKKLMSENNAKISGAWKAITDVSAEIHNITTGMPDFVRQTCEALLTIYMGIKTNSIDKIVLPKVPSLTSGDEEKKHE
jgi:hypothetical protein